MYNVKNTLNIHRNKLCKGCKKSYILYDSSVLINVIESGHFAGRIAVLPYLGLNATVIDQTVPQTNKVRRREQPVIRSREVFTI